MNRDACILSLAHVVDYYARKFYFRLPLHVADVDELTQVAWVGAIQAVDAYDAARANGNSLQGFAQLRIRGEIIDYLRRLDPLTRSHRDKLRKTGETIPVTLSLELDDSYQDCPMVDPDQDWIVEYDLNRLAEKANMTQKQYTALKRRQAGGLVLQTLGTNQAVHQMRKVLIADKRRNQWASDKLMLAPLIVQAKAATT